MGFKRRNGFKFNKNKDVRDRRDITAQVRENKADNSSQVKPELIQDGISKIAMKDLPKSSYAIKSDPYAELNEASLPYDFIKSYNTKYQASYKGNENIDGGYVSQYLTAVDSRVLNIFDAVKAEIGINYRYLNLTHRVLGESIDGTITVTGEESYEQSPIQESLPQVFNPEVDYRGSQILRKMYDAINEAVSQLDATTFTYLKINTSYSVMSTLCIPGVSCNEYWMDLGDRREEEGEEGTETVTIYTKMYCYTDVAAVILLSSLEYQTVLQSGLGVLKQINKMKNSFGTLVKMNYQRETDPINQFFGLLNKAAFKQLLESSKLCIMGEYVDADWARNTNILVQLLSRKADDMIDPLLELDGVYNMQKAFIMMARESNKFPTAEGDTKSGLLAFSEVDDFTVWAGGIGDQLADCRKTQVVVNSTTNRWVSLRPLCAELNRLLSPVETLAWSRNINKQGVATPTNRYNNIVYDIEGIDKILTRLKTQFGDLRTIFDKLSPLGLINYIKGVTVDITDDFNVKPVDYMLIDDVFKTLLGGNCNITFSPQTGRWTGWSLWNKFTGIPVYDAKSGGAFLSFCTKRFDLNNSVRTDYQYLPVMFSALSDSDEQLYDYVASVNRLGTVVQIKTSVASAMGQAAGLTRLAILPNFDTYDFKAPYVVDQVSLSNVNQDLVKMMLMSLADAHYDGVHTVYDVNDDVVAIYNYEIDPIQKSMVTYAKAFGPIKGVTDADADMGFAGLSGIKTK